MKIVVLGGSFNPPTVAHYKLMQVAIDTIGADKGVFVPVSNAYLKRKMRKANFSFCLSEELRYQMLKSMCEDDSRMSVSADEFGYPVSRTYKTMETMEQQYPDSEVYFLLGSDKLKLCTQWAKSTDFFERFRVAIFPRESVTEDNWLDEYPQLSKYADRFVWLEKIQGIENISSTVVRDAVTSGAEYDDLLCRGVRELMKTADLNFKEEIVAFKGEYEFLDNRYPSEIEWDGIKYSCVESAFQTSKFESREERKRLAFYSTDRLRQKGNQHTPTVQWDENKYCLMKELLLLKFRSYPELAERLKKTGSKILIYGITKNNTGNLCWGVDLYTWEGENRLGKLLMEVRDEI